MRIASAFLTYLALILPLSAQDAKPIDLGDRRELLVDDFLADRKTNLERRLHHPVAREVVLVHDTPWEGTGCGFHTIFRDGDVIRMYYIAGNLTNEEGTKFSAGPFRACYAESKDGIRWTRPELGLFEVNGSKKNNVIWAAPGLDNFTPFKDPNPACPADERYKAVGLGKGGLAAFKSADGIHWSLLAEKPIITKGGFDTQNNAFWDPVRKQYWCYIRDFHQGLRDIRVSTSPDFRTWTQPEMLKFADAPPDEQLYTNQVQPYYRAPHLFLGFPTRYVERGWKPSMKALPNPEHREKRIKFSPRYGTAVTDCLFMTSRDGRTFQRADEAFLRPGIERKYNWIYGDGYGNLGLLETPASEPEAPTELSMYYIEDNWMRATRLRRFTIRIDGFMSLHARQKAGELYTKPVVFKGKKLDLNFATSAAGNIRVGLLDAATGQSIPGFALADCDEIFGDTLERTVTWKDRSDIGTLAGRPIRLHFVMSDADLYALKFAD